MPCTQMMVSITSALSRSPVCTHTGPTRGQGGRSPGWGQAWSATPCLPLRRIPEGPWGPGSQHSWAQHPSPAAAAGISWQKGSHLCTFPSPWSECRRSGPPPTSAWHSYLSRSTSGKGSEPFLPWGPISPVPPILSLA